MAGSSGGGWTGLGQIARVLWSGASPFVRRRLAGVVALVIAAGVLAAVSPVALKFIVDALAGAGNSGSEDAFVAAGLYVSSLYLARLAEDLREVVFARARLRIFRTLREAVFGHLVYLPLQFHLDGRIGAVSQTVENGMEGLRITVHHGVFTVLPVMVELASILVVLVRVTALSYLFLFAAALGSYAALFAWCAVNVGAAARRASKADIEATGLITDVLLNYETVKCFTAETHVQDRVSDALGRSESEWVGFHREYAVSGLLASMVFIAFAASTVIWSICEVRQGRMTLGDFVLVNTYMLQVVRPVEMLGHALQGISQGIGMLRKLGELLVQPTEPRCAIGHAGNGESGALEFRHVCLSYGVNRRVLDGVSFRIETGGQLGIVGPSGSGKSSIVRLLMRMIEPESGIILLGDVPVAELALCALRCSVAVVPQDTVLFDGTIKYNIGFGCADAGPDEIEEAARIARLHDHVMEFPAGYETMVGERGMKMSGGERQRISIARAVLRRPRIFVFDEATSSLDARTEREILRSLCAVSKGTTTLVIAHRLSAVVRADEIVVLDGGRIAECGTHDILLRREGAYAKLWKSQQMVASVA